MDEIWVLSFYKMNLYGEMADRLRDSAVFFVKRWIFQAGFRDVPDESSKVPVREMKVPDRNRKVPEENESAG